MITNLMTSFCFDYFFTSLFGKRKKRERKEKKDKKKIMLAANPKSVITIFMSNTKHYAETLMKVLKCSHWLKFFSSFLYKEIDKCFY